MLDVVADCNKAVNLAILFLTNRIVPVNKSVILRVVAIVCQSLNGLNSCNAGLILE